MVLQGPNEIAATRQIQPVTGGGSGGVPSRPSQSDNPGRPEQAPQAAPAPANDSQVEVVARQLQETAQLFNKRLDFVLDSSTGRSMVRVLDADTDELIRELPPEKVIQLAAKIQEELGVIFDELA